MRAEFASDRIRVGARKLTIVNSQCSLRDALIYRVQFAPSVHKIRHRVVLKTKTNYLLASLCKNYQNSIKKPQLKSKIKFIKTPSKSVNNHFIN